MSTFSLVPGLVHGSQRQQLDSDPVEDLLSKITETTEEGTTVTRESLKAAVKEMMDDRERAWRREQREHEVQEKKKAVEELRRKKETEALEAQLRELEREEESLLQNNPGPSGGYRGKGGNRPPRRCASLPPPTPCPPPQVPVQVLGIPNFFSS